MRTSAGCTWSHCVLWRPILLYTFVYLWISLVTAGRFDSWHWGSLVLASIIFLHLTRFVPTENFDGLHGPSMICKTSAHWILTRIVFFFCMKNTKVFLLRIEYESFSFRQNCDNPCHGALSFSARLLPGPACTSWQSTFQVHSGKPYHPQCRGCVINDSRTPSFSTAEQSRLHPCSCNDLLSAMFKQSPTSKHHHHHLRRSGSFVGFFKSSQSPSNALLFVHRIFLIAVKPLGVVMQWFEIAQLPCHKKVK